VNQRTIQAGATQPIRDRLRGEQRVAAQELLYSLEARINSYIEEWWNKILDITEEVAEDPRVPSAIAPAVVCSPENEGVTKVLARRTKL